MHTHSSARPVGTVVPSQTSSANCVDHGAKHGGPLSCGGLSAGCNPACRGDTKYGDCQPPSSEISPEKKFFFWRARRWGNSSCFVPIGREHGSPSGAARFPSGNTIGKLHHYG